MGEKVEEKKRNEGEGERYMLKEGDIEMFRRGKSITVFRIKVKMVLLHNNKFGMLE